MRSRPIAQTTAAAIQSGWTVKWSRRTCSFRRRKSKIKRNFNW